jgi:hypothetical protein
LNEALKEYIQRRRQAKVTNLFGKIEMDAAYDDKKQRRCFRPSKTSRSKLRVSLVRSPCPRSIAEAVPKL